MDMLSTTNTRVTNYNAMIAMLTGIGRLLAWLLPTHCLHSLENRSPLQRAFRQCVEHVQTMVIALPGGLLACLVPTDCLRPLENWPPFHRAVRQSGGNLLSLRQGPAATGCPRMLWDEHQRVRLPPQFLGLFQEFIAKSKAAHPSPSFNNPAHK